MGWKRPFFFSLGEPFLLVKPNELFSVERFDSANCTTAGRGAGWPHEIVLKPTDISVILSNVKTFLTAQFSAKARTCKHTTCVMHLCTFSCTVQTHAHTQRSTSGMNASAALRPLSVRVSIVLHTQCPPSKHLHVFVMILHRADAQFQQRYVHAEWAQEALITSA